MQRDFSKLVQGNMIVDEYETEFDRLARHVPTMVPDENAKRDKFEHGLAMYIQKGIAMSNALETYTELVDRAKKLEAVDAEVRELTQADQKKRGRDSDFRGGQTSKGSAPYQPSGKQQWTLGASFKCGEIGHRIEEYPMMVGDSQSFQRTPVQTKSIQSRTIQNRTALAFPAAQSRSDRPRLPGRLHALTHQDAQTVGSVVSGTLPDASSYAYVLFDSGATHSFVSSSYAMLHSLSVMLMNHDLCISTPVGSDLVANSVSKMCPIRIWDRELVADLILLDLYDFDVILDMDWLSAHHALVDCNKKIVNFEILGEERFCFEGSGACSTPVILSAMQACQLLRQGYEAFLASVVEVESNDTFRVHPQDREVEFTVDLAPSTAPISKAPYRMAPVKMRELKEQLEELLEKGFVRPNVSPWEHQYCL
ncbi:uncharacterized protein LOC143883093 [Tasmannia lanceolata]|uniref:uncharacterized protein LOC143883093 n=1 Tax=Tasmannia lanceolata TaxID=3420 RepID=UPI004062FDC8